MQEKTTCLLARGWARWAMAGVAGVAGVADVAEVTMKLEEHRMHLEKLAEKHYSESKIKIPRDANLVPGTEY
jgi:hypothetical protein